MNRLFLLFLIVGVLVATAEPASAQDGRLYLGLQAEATRLDADYRKTTNFTHPGLVRPELGATLFDGDSADSATYGAGVLVGYRLSLNARGLYLSGEFDVAYHGGTVRSRLAGIGNSPGRNLEGESWPYSWSFEKDRSYGLTLRLGGTPSLLESWAGADASVYALAGVRRIRTRFGVAYSGCAGLDAVTITSLDDCPSGDFVSSSRVRNPYLTAWSGGLGLEKMLGAHVALRGDVRYTWHGDHSLVTLANDAINVLADLDGNEVGVTWGLIWYF